jgi:hypothetical protein
LEKTDNFTNFNTCRSKRPLSPLSCISRRFAHLVHLDFAVLVQALVNGTHLGADDADRVIAVLKWASSTRIRGDNGV